MAISLTRAELQKCLEERENQFVKALMQQSHKFPPFTASIGMDAGELYFKVPLRDFLAANIGVTLRIILDVVYSEDAKE